MFPSPKEPAWVLGAVPAPQGSFPSLTRQQLAPAREELPAEDFPRRAPFVWSFRNVCSFRNPARSVLGRFVAQMLVQLMVVTPLPPELQLAVAMLSLSPLWGFVETAPAEAGDADPAPIPEEVTEDPFGNVATFTRSEYVAPDGSVGIGPGGGTVRGPGGVELRIPEGALDAGVTFKIEGLTPDAFDALFPGQKPSLGTDSSGNPLGTMGSALKIEVDGEPTFHKEIDLAFPLPEGLPENPSDAFFHVFRRLAGAEGTVVYETLDHAFVEGEDPDAKVVTASPPFGGLRAMFGGYDGFGAMTSATLSYAIMMWTFNDLLPGLALPGAVTGKVLRAKWQEGGSSATPTYEPVPGVLVWAEDAAGTPLESATQLDDDTVAVTQADGTFTLWDHRYVGGPVTVRAQTVGADDTIEVREATAFQIGPQDTKSLGLGAYQNVATANITFPAVEPPPPPAEVEIVVRKPDDSEAGGFVVSGTPLTLSFRSNYTVTGASVQGQAYAVVKDPQGDPELYLASEPFTPQNPGSYTISATALPPIGAAITVSRTIRVLAEGGAVDTLHDQPPAVAQVIPKAGAKGVAVNTFPQIFFTEPVRNIRDAGSGIENVTLVEDGAFGDAVPVRVGGVGPDGTVYEEVTSAQATVTSLTIQPLVGLKYNTTYRLVISSDIEDLDEEAGQPAPKQLVVPDPAPTFTTFGPEAVGGAEDFGSPGITVLGDRAYLAKILGAGAIADVKGFDVSDPIEPLLLSGSRTLVGRAVDIVGVEESSVTSGRMVVVATGSSSRARPANIHVLDVNSDSDFRYIGAASLTSGPIEGFIARTAIKDGLLYSATTRKGIQVVDLQQASDQFEDGGLGTLPNGTPVALQLNSDGQGWGQEAVLQTIPLWTKDNGLHYALNDIDVADIQGQRIAVVAGEIGLLIANTITGSYTFPLSGEAGPMSTLDAGLSWGRALALGRLDDRDVAVVAGMGGTTSAGSTLLLMVVDLTNLYSPQGMGAVSLGLPSGYDVVDVILDGDTALVGVQNGAGTDGFVQIVNLAEASQPQLAGKIDGVAGRLALGESGLLFGSVRSIFGGTSDLGGVKVAATDALAVITGVDPAPIRVSAGNEVFEDVGLSYKLIPADPDVTAANVHIDVRTGSRVADIPGTVQDGTGSVTWEQGTIINPLETYEARARVERDGQPMNAPPRRLTFDKVPLAITTRDRLLRVQFALGEQGLFAENNYSVRVFLAAQGASFGASPSFTITSQQIEAAYPNESVWWDDLQDGTGKSQSAWVTRKIDRMDLPPGTDASIRRQAFEIGTMLAGYPQVKVVVVADETGTELAVQEGVVSAQGQWAEVFGRVNDRVRLAGGHFVPDDPILPPPTSFDAAVPFAAFGGLTYRAVYWVLDNQMPLELLNGLLDGFHDGWEGDKETVAMLRDAAVSPIESAKALGGFISDFVSTVTTEPGIGAIVDNLLGQVGEISMPTAGQAAYYTGYLVGFLFEQILAGAAVTVATLGIGAAVAKAAQLLKGVGWVAGLAIKARNLAKSLAYVLKGASEILPGGRAAKASLAWLRELGPKLDNFIAKYPQPGAILQRAGRVATTAKAAAQRAIHWLTFMDRMSDAAALRFMRFFERVGAEVGDAWLTRWAALNNGKRAVKDGFEAYDKAGEVSEGLHHVLVVAADLDHPTAGRNYARDFVEKYAATPDGDRVPGVASRLMRDAQDVRYSDTTIAETIRVHSDPDPRIGLLNETEIEASAQVIEFRSCVVQ